METAKKKILIVDDEPAILEELGEALSDEFHVYQASNGLKALSVTRVALPELVLMDIRMPEMDGLEACRRLKRDAAIAHIPVIMVSGNGGIMDIENGFKAGADSYVVKPIMPDKLIDKINYVLTKPGRRFIRG
jgi:DNA-binding response OmpR family regulator